MAKCTTPARGWHHGEMLAFDTETTGVDVETDRIVTASLVEITPGAAPVVRSYLIDPGVDIPEAAAAIHGITTAHAKQHGEQPVPILATVAGLLGHAMARGVPVVLMNAPYDLTILDRECRRHGVESFDQRVDDLAPVVDVRILDKHVDPYRKGKRRLADLCEHYDAVLDGAHDSAHDAIAAARVAWRIAQRHPEIGGMSPAKLHAAQVEWAAEQADSFRAYLQRTGKPCDDVRGDWPIYPPPGPVQGVIA